VEDGYWLSKEVCERETRKAQKEGKNGKKWESWFMNGLHNVSMFLNGLISIQASIFFTFKVARCMQNRLETKPKASQNLGYDRAYRG
jgi:hypothetical protein